jgi:hypothetical protein
VIGEALGDEEWTRTRRGGTVDVSQQATESQTFEVKISAGRSEGTANIQGSRIRRQVQVIVSDRTKEDRDPGMAS